MTNDQGQTLVSRQAPETGIHPVGHTTLDVELRTAEAIASARGMLPAQYANNVGACFLIAQWAQARGVDTFHAMTNVNFVKGRPVVSAQLMHELAENAGYRVTVQPGQNEATATVTDHSGAVLGAATFTLEEASAAGLLGKDNWKHYSQDMLVARAKARAIRWYAPGAMSGVYVEGEEVDIERPAGVVDAPDALNVLTPPIEAETVVVDAEVVEDTVEDTESKLTKAEPEPKPTEPDPMVYTSVEVTNKLRSAGIVFSEALKKAQATDGSITSKEALGQHPDLLDQIITDAR